MKRINYLILFCLALVSCSPDENFPDESKRLVVDGWIEQGAVAQIIATYSSSFLSNIDSVSALGFMASRAKVSVSTFNANEVLTLRSSDLYFPPLVYSGYEIRGKTGQTYSMEVVLQGETYTASATILPPPVVDSVWMEVVNDTCGVVRLIINDPPSVHNYYRIYAQRYGIDKQPVAVYLPNYADDLFDGKVVELPIFRGTASNLAREKGLYFDLHDKVLIKVCSMDKETYTYWSRIQLQLSGSKNPFSSNGRPLPTNISGNAIGYWCAYGVTQKWISPTVKRK